MDVEGEVARAILNELTRQAAESGGNLNVVTWERGLTVQGPIDLQSIALAVVEAVVPDR